ncbi:MAG: YjbQ family protein [Rubrivivax sp.]|nr:YjbQ family protein [Rubrivivax sp.]
MQPQAWPAITGDVQGWVAAGGFDDGLLTLFGRHTSASLLIQENADPDVRADLDRFFARLVPDGDALFRHQDEGPDALQARPALSGVASTTRPRVLRSTCNAVACLR